MRFVLRFNKTMWPPTKTWVQSGGGGGKRRSKSGGHEYSFFCNPGGSEPFRTSCFSNPGGSWSFFASPGGK